MQINIEDYMVCMPTIDIAVRAAAKQGMPIDAKFEARLERMLRRMIGEQNELIK